MRGIGRTLWGGERTVESPFDFPVWLNETSKATRLNCEYREVETVSAELGDFFLGRCPRFLERTEAMLQRHTSSFVRLILEADLITLTEFYERAQELAELRAFHQEGKVIPQGKVDPLAYLMRLRQREAGAEMALASMDGNAEVDRA